MAFTNRTSAFFFCLATAMPVVVSGQTSQVSVVVLHSGQNETTIRLAAELSALGYSAVLLLHPNRALWTDQVRSIMRTYRAAALINAASLKTRVDIWMPAPGSAGMQLTVDTVDATNTEGNSAATILKTVEALRAGLMKLDIRAPDRSSAARTDRTEKNSGTGMDTDLQNQETSTDGDTGSFPRGRIERQRNLSRFNARPGRLSLLLGPAITYGFGDFPPEWQVLLSAKIGLGNFISITLSGYAPTAPMTLKNSYGAARVWNGALIAALRLGMRPQDKRLVPWAELGIGPNFSRIKGEGTPPEGGESYVNGDDRYLLSELLFRFGIRLWLTQRIALEGALHLGDTLPQLLVVLGEQRASFSRPLFGGTVQLSVELF